VAHDMEWVKRLCDFQVRPAKLTAPRGVTFLILAIIAGAFAGFSLGQNSQFQIHRMEQRSAECGAKLSQLQAQKEQAIEELRHGLFCSKCKRSKSEIERAERVSFEMHLQDVKGHAVASPEELNEKAAFYDRQIAALQKQIAQLEAMKGQMASAARQQADLERQRQQRDRDQERLREMLAQQQKLQQERDRIVNRAQAKADGYQRAGQAAADGIQQIGNVLLQKMELDRQEREQQRAQERYDRQMERLQQQIQAQEQQLANVNNDSTASGGDIELPAPVQIYEPPGEGQQQRMAEDQIRETGVTPTVVFRDGQSFKRDFPAYDSGGLAPVTRFRTIPYEPPQGLSDYLSDTGSQDGWGSVRQEHGQWNRQVVGGVEQNEELGKFGRPLNQTPQDSAQNWWKKAGASGYTDAIRETAHVLEEQLENQGVGNMNLRDAARQGIPGTIKKTIKETFGKLWDAKTADSLSRQRFGRPYEELDAADQLSVDFDLKIVPDILRAAPPTKRGEFVDKWASDPINRFSKDASAMEKAPDR
jgi:hypothetical protein